MTNSRQLTALVVGFGRPVKLAIAADRLLCLSPSLKVGGSSGIGLSTVKHFLRKGVKPCIADINEKTGRAAQEELRKLGHEISFVRIDVTDNESIQAGIKQAAEALGQIDFAVNTAGGSPVV